MTVEVMPVGTKCSLACKMCFQNPIRRAGNQSTGGYDLEAMKKGLEAENYHFTLFGGEPLLTPIDDLEELWRWGLEKFGQNGIQTSASCVTEKHFELFEKYKVSVGISIEGPGELNDIRWAGSLERTRKTTEKVEAVIFRLLEAGRPPSIITTLNRGNASPARLPRLLEWFKELDRRGLRYANIHLMEIDDPELRREWSLTAEENAAALLAFADLQNEVSIKFQPITEMVGLLVGDDADSNCVWNACDPYTTRAVRGINAEGGRVNCSRSAKAGVDMQKADHELLVRPIALYHTAQELGGCHGCRFWFACKGSCPGEALGGDWRQKTEYCDTLKLVFGELERRLGSLGLDPISRSEGRRRGVERKLLEAFGAGRPLRIYQALEALENKGASSSSSSSKDVTGPHGDAPHGDHTDTARPLITHGDSGDGIPHGDQAHGDQAHGDHMDAAKPVITHGDSWEK